MRGDKRKQRLVSDNLISGYLLTKSSQVLGFITVSKESFVFRIYGCIADYAFFFALPELKRWGKIIFFQFIQLADGEDFSKAALGDSW